jgi:acetyl coenzyme A synthetase (ADP forming)-like protein
MEMKKTKKIKVKAMKKIKKMKVVKEKSVKIQKVKNISKGSGLDMFFKAEKIAVIGASHETGKIGNVIFRNLYQRKTVYPVNPNASEIFHVKCYKSVLEIEDNIDLAIIAIKADFVPAAVEECGKKKIKNVVIVSAGFKEVGNNLLDKKLHDALEKYGIRCIGPNCLGILDSYSELDSIFLSKQKLKRPSAGGISFISQSGALGGMILDMASQKRYGIAKFISYGNAMNLNECDFLEYLGKDPETKVICLYVEQIKEGERFFDVAREVSKTKPVLVFKGGMTQEGSKAVLSHTGSLAGDGRIYQGVFKQTGLIQVDRLEDLFGAAGLFEKFSKFTIKDKRIGIITNGGGIGVVCADNIIKNNLKIAEIETSTKAFLKKNLPQTINATNPIDLMGDTTDERYKIALETYLQDKNVDFIVVVVLYQTPLVTEGVAEIIARAAEINKKPIIVLTSGSEEGILSRLEDKGILSFEFPEEAIEAVKKFLDNKVR